MRPGACGIIVSMNLGFPEMLFIFLMALIIFGPKKLPEIGRQIGKALAEFKRASNEFKSQLETEMRQLEIDETIRKEKESVLRALEPPSGTVNVAPASEPKPAEAVTASETAKAVPVTETSQVAAALPAPTDPFTYPDFYPPEEPSKTEAAKGTDV